MDVESDGGAEHAGVAPVVLLSAGEGETRGFFVGEAGGEIEALRLLEEVGGSIWGRASPFWTGWVC